MAEFPPHDIGDDKRMMLGERFSRCNTPEELLSVLPKAAPVDRGNLLREVKEGVYKFNAPMLRGIPKLEWSQLCNLRAEREEAPLTAGPGMPSTLSVGAGSGSPAVGGPGTAATRPTTAGDDSGDDTIDDYELVEV